MAPSITLLKDLKPYKSGRRIQVKVIHSWKQQTKYGGQTLEMVLADETGTKIQASCRQCFVSKIQRELPLNEWRIIDTFNLTPATGQYRTTTHPYKIALNNNSSIAQSELKIDNSFLSLTSFSLSPLKTQFLIDVFGEIVDIGDLQTVHALGEETKKCEFYLRDATYI